MSRRRSTAIVVGAGERCPTCSATMSRCEHPKGWRPRQGQPYHFAFWDRCSCGHLQHYEAAKVYQGPARSALPHRNLTPSQLRASRALKDQLPMSTSKRRRQWLAEMMGIEERFAIIADMDDVECATVVEICTAKEGIQRYG